MGHFVYEHRLQPVRGPGPHPRSRGGGGEERHVRWKGGEKAVGPGGLPVEHHGNSLTRLILEEGGGPLPHGGCQFRHVGGGVGILRAIDHAEMVGVVLQPLVGGSGGGDGELYREQQEHGAKSSHKSTPRVANMRMPSVSNLDRRVSICSRIVLASASVTYAT